MSEKLIGQSREAGVIAIAQEQGKLRAVKLTRRGRSVEVEWTRSTEGDQAQLGGFAGECGLSDAAGAETADGVVAVVGFDSSGMVFHHIDVPAVRQQELDAIVRLQAETRLPLPAEQMELAWRAGEVRDGRVGVTIAAARKEQLRDFADNLQGFEPAGILLNCEGLVKAWRTFFAGTDQSTVVVSLGRRNTQVCLAQGGRLVNAVNLDIGMEDFVGADEAAEQMAIAERFCQDLRSVLELFGYTDPSDIQVVVLSDGGSFIAEIAACLCSAGLNAETAVPDVRKLTGPDEFGVRDIYEHRVPIGLGAIALDGDIGQLNIFERVYQPASERARRRWLSSPKLTAPLAALMLILLLVVSYVVAVAGNNHLGRLLEEEANFKEIVERQKLIKAVARERIDLLELLSEINLAEHEGVMLHAFEFKKGRPVKISGQADGAEQAYKFQEFLQDRKGMRNVEIIPTKAKDGDKVNFDITFHYKTYTTKKSSF